MTDDILDQKKARLEKLAALEKKGINAYPQEYRPTYTAQALNEQYKELPNDTQTEDVVRVAGRIRAIRNSGMFMDVWDATGKVQIFSSLENLPAEEKEILALLDLGDIIGVEGTVRRTKRGELSVATTHLTVLGKSLQPFPDKFHGLQDADTKYRQRYLDMIVTPETTQTLVLRSRIISTIRRYLDAKGFLEVETPLLHPIMGGATAKPFITHHNSLDMDLYLRVAPELYLKRLIIGGLPAIYEIGRMFRNEGIDTSHNPEFTMMELYWVYKDYHDMMDLFEDLVQTLAKDLLGTTTIKLGDKVIELGGHWPRKSMLTLVQEATGVDFLQFKDGAEAAKAAEQLGVSTEKNASWGKVVEAVFEEKCEQKLIQPIFVTDHPLDISPLTKTHRDNPRLVERFEPFINGWEVGNAYSELTNPLDQRQRFEEQVRLRAGGDAEAQMMDEDFVTALEYGMPPTGGLGVGIDRLVMILAQTTTIRDVIAFPTMRKKN